MGIYGYSWISTHIPPCQKGLQVHACMHACMLACTHACMHVLMCADACMWRRAIELYRKVVSNLEPYRVRKIGFYPTSNGVPIYWAFPFNGMAFPFNGMAFPFSGRSQLPGVAMAWRQRQAMAKWCLGRRKWRGPRPGPDPDLGGPDPALFSSLPAPLGHGLAPQPGHGNAQ